MTRTPRLLRSLALLAATAIVAGACAGTAATPAPTAPVGPSAPAGGGIPDSCPKSQPPALGADEIRVVTLATEKGDIELTIQASLAPIATGNFVALAECGYYDDVVFHRLVPGFVIQGGDGAYGREPAVDFNRVGTGGPGYTIADEVVTVPYRRGTVAMARSRLPNSQGSQFFIVLDDEAGAALASANTYAIMGQVTKGMEVVDAIGSMPNAGEPAGNLALTPVGFDATVTTP
jgi:cyclophilin family peptidyl-prolyl cis-trans isomerase